MSFVSSLKLSNFRCYGSVRFEDIQSGLIVISGSNGAGKTNILEAVSLLTPGRGLRGARVIEIQKNNAEHPWAVASEVTTSTGDIKIGTGRDAANDKRIVRIQGTSAKSQNALADYISCIWLTPQMDRLFLDSSRERRRFLDRMVFAFDPGHSGRITRYENALSQRSKLLKEGRADPSWLDSLESQMAETGVSIAAARLDFVSRLQTACDKENHDHFPLAHLRAAGTLEELLGNAPALEVEDLFKYQLKESREKDSYTGGAATGVHKSDLAVKMAEKDMAADQCSTGEQKALLIGIILSHARLIAAERGAPPILLLDEVAAHLDENRRAALYDLLQELGGQVWLTGTDIKLFDAIQNKAQFYKIENAAVI